MSVAFSGDDSAIIKEKLDIGPAEPTPDDQLDEKYHLEACCRWLKEHNYKIAALQFPDELLVDATPIALHLQTHTDCHVYILADTSYGSCCVDEVAAEHVSADCVVHFGHSCLSPTSRLPVYYVFVDLPLDVSSAADTLCPALPPDRTVVVFTDVQYQHALADLCRELSARLPSVVAAEPPPPSPSVTEPASATEAASVPPSATEAASEPASPTEAASEPPSATGAASESPSVTEAASEPPSATGAASESPSVTETDPSSEPAETLLMNRRIPLSGSALDAACVLYVGGEGRLLTCLAMALGDTPLLVWDPRADRRPGSPGAEAGRAVRRRYYMVERTKDAARVGILVGTLAVHRYREAISRLKQLLRAAGKRYYTLLCGKLNVAKLANFPELDVLVLVSCPESALLESREFLQPVVTPYEAELACNPARPWSSRYVAEFGRLLPGGGRHVPLPEHGEVVTDVSLVTGKLRSCGVQPDDQESGQGQDGSLVARGNLAVAVHDGGAGQALAERGWKGLEQRLGDTPVTAAIQGQRGVAAGYEDEGATLTTQTTQSESAPRQTP